MKTIQELEEELKKLREEASKLHSKEIKIEELILSMKSDEVKPYLGKYLKCNRKGYLVYLFVENGNKDYCYDGWALTGKGFSTYATEQGFRVFREESLGNHISIEDIKTNRFTVTELTEEEFYADREKYLKEIMISRYN